VATYNPINTFTKHLLEGVHNFTAAAHVVKAMLVNSPAPLATNVLKADLTEIAAGNGYTAGGNTLSTSTGAVTNSANKASVTADVTITVLTWLRGYQTAASDRERVPFLKAEDY
jgi:hypothetical protein